MYTCKNHGWSSGLYACPLCYKLSNAVSESPTSTDTGQGKCIKCGGDNSTHFIDCPVWDELKNPPTAHTEELSREGEVTAMQELIEWLKVEIAFIADNDSKEDKFARQANKNTLEKATELLAKEKEREDAAWEAGYKHCDKQKCA